MSKKESKNKSQVDFIGQHEGEEVLFVFRRHMIAMRKGFYLLLAPFLIASLPILIWEPSIELLLLALGGFGLGILLFLYHLMLWYFTIYIVTNERIRQVTRHGFFGKDVVELRLSKIQNISYNIPGLSGEIFKYGTIVIQTYVGDLVIHNVENPDEIYGKLQSAANKAIGSHLDHEEIIKQNS